MNRTFIKLLFCQLCTLFANAALRFALPLYLLRQTGSASLYGGITALAMLPMLAGILSGGVLADRYPKQEIMMLLDAVSAFALIAAFFLFDRFPMVGGILSTLCLLYAAEGLYQPAVQSSLPLLLQDTALARGNAAVQLADMVDELLGPLLGSVMLHTLGLRGLLLLCAVCFAGTAIFLRTLSIPHTPVRQHEKLRLSDTFHCLFRRGSELRCMTIVLALLNLAVVPAITVGVPVLVVQTLAMSDAALAFTQSIMSAGGFAGGLLAGALAEHTRQGHKMLPLWCISAVCLLMGLSILPGIPSNISYLAITALAFFQIAAAVPFQISLFTTLQVSVPQGGVGRSMSLLTTAACLTQPVGQALYGAAYMRLSAIPWAVLFLAASFSIIINFYAAQCLARF